MNHLPKNPLKSILDRQAVVILDGGLASTLEERGFDLDDDLWSARVLLEDPEAIGQIHEDFLTAGADCIITATYQASLPGLKRRGFNQAEARAQLELAVELALAARNRFLENSDNGPDRPKPLVAASIGPYGAYLADGSEYTGNYGISSEELRRFHAERWEILAQSRADLLACETLPSLEETRVLLDLLPDTPGRWAWFTFSCRDGDHLWDGTPFVDALELCAASSQVCGIGINCTAPEFISPLLTRGRQLTDKPLIVYPNSGEIYLPDNKSWAPAPRDLCLQDLAPRWAALGADVIGGCCRVGPETITAVRTVLLD